MILILYLLLLLLFLIALSIVFFLLLSTIIFNELYIDIKLKNWKNNISDGLCIKNTVNEYVILCFI